MENVNVTIRMDKNLKHQADIVFNELGMSFTTAVTLFTKQAVREKKIPFNISLDVPNQKTIDALNELKAMKENKEEYKPYQDLLEFLSEVEK